VSKLWYYADPNSSGHVGPLTLEGLQGILADLPHASDALVWCEDMPEWKRAGEIPAFRSRAVAPPPLPKASRLRQSFRSRSGIALRAAVTPLMRWRGRCLTRPTSIERVGGAQREPWPPYLGRD